MKHATEMPNGEYAYLAPLYKQAKAAAWKTLKGAVPSPPAKINESELRADFPNGAQIKLLGADDYDALRGQHLDGIVLDEYALIDPAAWGEVIRPALSVKRGFGIFIGTPKGRNHFWKLYQDARHDELWLTATYTYRDSGVIDAEEIALARRQMTPDEFAQEYECSWEAALKGAYYARQLEAARASGRIKAVPWEPALPVQTFWDLGWSDATAIVFIQQVGRELHVIDYLEASGEGLEHYVREVARKPYLYGRHYLPHDAGHAQQGLEGKTLAQQAQAMGLRPVTVLGNTTDVLPGIDTARRILARCWFDETKCALLLDALSAYRQEWDDKRQDWRQKPLHDWASHGADAFRYMAITVRDEQPTRVSGWALEGGEVRKPPAPAKIRFHPYDVLHGRR